MQPSIDLYCLPCAGASASMYLRWRRVLPAWIKVLPVELPGRGMRLTEPFVEDYPTLVERLCAEIAHDGNRRWAIFGHSMGALLAYGVTSRLQSLRAPLPALLFVCGSAAPGHLDAGRFPDTDSDAELIADLHAQGGTPREVFDNPELLQLTLDALRADYRVCESVNGSRQPALAVPLTVLAGRDDDIEAHRIEAWRNKAGRGIGLHWFDGGHFFIREHERQVLRRIVLSLRDVPGAGRRAGAHSAAMAWPMSAEQ